MKLDQAYTYLRNILSKYIYLVYGILAGILLGACFFDFFAYIACAYIIVVSLFLDDTHVLCLLFFILPFDFLFYFETKPLVYIYRVIQIYLYICIFARYIYNLTKQKTKPNYKILIMLIVFIIYTVLPVHRVGVNDLVFLALNVGLIYVISQKGIKIRFSVFAEVFCIAVILSCCLGLLRYVSPRLSQVMGDIYALDSERFYGLMPHPNGLGMVIITALSLVSVLQYKKKINSIKYVVYNVILVFFGIQTLSRNFVITLFVLYLVFAILYLIKYKKQSLKFLGLFALAIVVTFFIAFDKSSIIFSRISTNEIEMVVRVFSIDMEKVMNGEIFYDPGRIGLWKLYLQDITSSASVFLFGRGLSRPWIGQMAAHNDYIQTMWVNGLVGVLLYVLVFCAFIDFKKLNWATVKEYLYTLIFAAPILVVLFTEHYPFGKLIWVILLLLINFKDEDKEKGKKENKKSQVNKMKFMEEYEKWFKSDVIDEKTKAELRQLDKEKDKKEIEDRFMTNLEFGTGGMRGIVGAGTNRLNKYTIGKATQGLANYLKQNYSEKDLERGVVIAYDTRNTSVEFSEVTSDVLTANGIKTFLFSVPVPTPELSFAVKHKNAIAGIVITASHNPKEYNGYKVYDEFGCQIVPSQAEELIKFVNDCDSFSKINFKGDKSKEQKFDCTDEFCDAVLKQSIFKDKQAKKDLKVVYTPLHGTGNIPVRKTLSLDGFENVFVQKEQEIADGNFPTVKVPNPEDKNALSLAIELAKEVDGDIVLGNDPDCDRVGVAVKTNDGFRLLTGNQIGALLVDYICGKKDFKKLKNPAVIKTVVTSELGAEIAKKYGLNVFSTLTGFKFIGEKITQFEKAKLENNEEQNYSFVMGYEESYGYLVGTHARDKDAVVSSMLICEMASEYKSYKKTLLDKINEIYDEFGVYKDFLDSFTLKGIDGISKTKQIMKTLREEETIFENIKEKIDYKKDVMAEKGFGLLPKSDVIKFVFVDGSWIAVRPSGTEPKIKFYYSIKGSSIEEAENSLEKLRKQIKQKFDL